MVAYFRKLLRDSEATQCVMGGPLFRWASCFSLTYVLEKLSSHQVAALFGLAPFNRDSGQMKGKRCIKGGRALIRTVLYMAMLSAIQHNPVMKKFYEKRVAQGKHKKLGITASMRKMMTMLNTKVRNDQEWKMNH